MCGSVHCVFYQKRYPFTEHTIFVCDSLLSTEPVDNNFMLDSTFQPLVPMKRKHESPEDFQDSKRVKAAEDFASLYIPIDAIAIILLNKKDSHKYIHNTCRVNKELNTICDCDYVWEYFCRVKEYDREDRPRDIVAGNPVSWKQHFQKWYKLRFVEKNN